MASTPQTLIGSGTTTGATTPATTTHTQHGSHHLHHTGKRLRHFLRPNGKKVHIAGSPEEASTLRRTLLQDDKDGDIDLVIHGSPEHLEALRHTHQHHSEKHQELKRQHGDLATEFERVIRDLDALSNELHMVTSHAVSLDANFSKYGYSAHLRTKDSPSSSAASMNSEGELFDKDAWAAERKLGSTMRFYQKPIVRQYFHKGLLWRAKEAQEVASYELFIDLFYVGIVAITGDAAVEHATGESLLHFCIVFIMGWKFWSDIGLLISWFDSDDILRRFSVLFILTCLLGFTTNIADAFEHTYTPLVSFYLAARLFMGFSLLWYAYDIPMVRSSMVGHGVLNILPAAFWIGSIYVEDPHRQGLIWPALFLDTFGSTLMLLVQRPDLWLSSQQVRSWVKKRFEFFPGANIEHRIERTGAFVTLVFGSCVLGLLYQSSREFGINAFFGKAVLGLVQAFTFNWIYFEIDSWNLHAHAIRRSVISALLWISIHLPFIMSFVLSASALASLVRAHDAPDSPLDSLHPTFISRSEEEVSFGLRWFYCGGLGIALLCMAIISATHTHKKIPNVRLDKHNRLVFRGLVAVAIICLPLAPELNSLQLVGATTGLVGAVLVLELVGASCAGENVLWDRDCRRNKARYEGECSIKRAELQRMSEKGIVHVEELARRETGVKGLAANV